MGFYPKNDVSVVLPYLDESTIKATASDALTGVTAVYAKFSQQPPVLNPNPDSGQTGYGHSDPDLELNIYYFHPDHLGSSSYISNAAGVVTQHMEYLPFGETLTDDHINSFNSPFKYNGKEFDEETGNYYYGARYYDPKWSIFISVDPLAKKTMSAYGYCYQNPINLTDPTGMSADPPLKGMDTPNGTVHTDSDGTWVFNQKTNTWVGQNGAPDFSNSIGLPELIINSPGKPKSAMDGYFHPAYDTSKPNPYSPSTDWRYSVAIAGVVALPVLIEAYGVGTLLEFALEEAAEEAFQQATGIPVVINPVDIVEQGIKKGARNEIIELSSLNPTHYPTRSKNKVKDLINDIRANGIKILLNMLHIEVKII